MPFSMVLAALFIFTLPDGPAGQIIDAEDPEIEHLKPRAEGLVDLDDPILRLNRFSFEKTVLHEDSRNQVKNWVILFCPAWFEPCQALEPHYRSTAMHWQDQLNNALLSSEVRFAAVDCATEKALCNSQNVGMDYPKIWHYRNHEQVASWNGESLQTDRSRLMAFLTQEFANTVDDNAAQTDEDKDFQEEEEASAGRKDLLLIFVAIAGNALIISRGNSTSEETPRNAEVSEEKAPVKSPRTFADDEQESIARLLPKQTTARLLPKEWIRDRPSIEL